VEGGLENYYKWCIVLCATMSVFTLSRVPKKGISALFLSLAFVMFGSMLYGLLHAWPVWVRAVQYVLIGVLLIADWAARLRPPTEKPKP